MAVVVNVMLSLMSVMSPRPALCNLSARTVVKLCTLGVFGLGVSLVSWTVMIYAYVSWISSLSSSSLFLIPFMLPCSMMRFLSLRLLGLCACVVFVVLGLSVRLSCYPMLWGRLLRWLWCMYCCLCCENVRVRWWRGSAGVASGRGVVSMSAYMGGTRGSGVLSSAGDVLQMSVVRGVSGVCDMCMCLARGRVGGVRSERIGLGIYQSWRNKDKVGYVFVFWLRWSGWCWGGSGRVGLGQGLGGCCGVKSVFVESLDDLCWWQVHVSVYCARRMPAHLGCTQCSIMLHHIDICFLTCICLWQISQIQTCLREVVWPGFVSTSPAFMRSNTSQPVGPHDCLTKKQ